jgi:acetamidase/formamidase
MGENMKKSHGDLVKLRKISQDEKPVLTVESGETLEFEIPDFSGGAITRKSKPADIKALQFSKGYALAGPIWVEGTEKGDLLEVELLSFEHHGWGYTAIFPEVEQFNLADYPEERFEPSIAFWEVHDKVAVWKEFNVHVPIHPFLGVVGTAPFLTGAFNPLPPRESGGNLDCKHLTAGAKLYLPVHTEGARLFLGDPHLAMGDGEVYSSAIEAPLKVKVRVQVRKDLKDLDPPVFVVRRAQVQDVFDHGYIGFMGVARTVDEAAEIAARKALGYFCKKLGMNPAEAAILLGVTLDLTISEIPDLPMKVVSGLVPLSFFPGVSFP